jgi:hypothetical protein
MNNAIPDKLLEALSPSTIEALANIASVYVCGSHGDASQAMDSGAVLLGVARVDNDKEWNGFRFLLGLPKNIKPTPYLQNFFPNAK